MDGTHGRADASFVRRVPAGAVVFEEGDVGDEFFIVLSGAVTVRRGTGAAAREIARLGTGEFFGEQAIVDRRPRSATVTAGEAGAVLLAIDAARFVYLVSQQPGFALLVMETLSVRSRPGGAADAPAAGRAGTRDGGYETVEIDARTWQLRARSRASNAYLLRGRTATVLVDTGLPAAAGALRDALASLGARPEDVDLVVLTHEHFDHIANVGLFAGAAVAAHGLAANKIRLGDDFATMAHAFGGTTEPFAVDRVLGDGDTLDTGSHVLDVLHTPGHSSGGIALHDARSGLAICGDTVLKGGPIGGIFGSGNISDLIFSIETLRGRGATRLLPGHGPLSDRPDDDMAATLERCRTLLEDSKALFDTLQAHESVMRVVNAYRDLNRSFASR